MSYDLNRTFFAQMGDLHGATFTPHASVSCNFKIFHIIQNPIPLAVDYLFRVSRCRRTTRAMTVAETFLTTLRIIHIKVKAVCRTDIALHILDV